MWRKKIKMKNHILTIFCLLFLQSCLQNIKEKDAPTSFDITFVDHYTNQPIPNLKVAFRRQYFAPFWGPPPEILDTFITDANGSITHSFQNAEKYLYDLWILNNSNYFSAVYISIKTGLANTSKIKLKNYNKTRLVLNDVSKKYAEIEVTILKTGSGYTGKCGDTTLLLKSVPEESTNVVFHLSNVNLRLYHTIDTTLYIPKVDTFNFTLGY